MRSLFLDSNVVVKYYYSEEGSAWVRSLIDADDTVCFVSMLAIVEVTSALSRVRREGQLGQRRFEEMIERFYGELHTQRFLSRDIDQKMLEFASVLALRYPLKAYDAIQVASALSVHNLPAAPDFLFVSGDQKVINAAKLEGLTVDDPANHLDEDQSESGNPARLS
ncbi:MAG: type II toxin-antitoxin system VapC family toxin [Caldilineaceae bacterium]|nr:type II toxin-antitoxin system VapC family toxin [Caldilineaceae bacterium]